MDAGCTLPLRNYKAVLEASYIGTHFGLGWQRQSDAVESASRGNGSIQRSLEDAAACVLPAVLAQWQAQGGAVPPPTTGCSGGRAWPDRSRGARKAASVLFEVEGCVSNANGRKQSHQDNNCIGGARCCNRKRGKRAD